MSDALWLADVLRYHRGDLGWASRLWIALRTLYGRPRAVIPIGIGK